MLPPAWRPGERLEFGAVERLRGWLPDEVWERRDVFFFEGMQLEVGPCYRRYPVAPFFEQATAANAGKASLDADGNLLGFAGTGLPFAPGGIATEMTEGERFNSLRSWPMPVDRCARSGLEGFRQRKYLHVPGVVWKVLAALSNVAPEPFASSRVAAEYRASLESLRRDNGAS